MFFAHGPAPKPTGRPDRYFRKNAADPGKAGRGFLPAITTAQNKLAIASLVFLIVINQIAERCALLHVPDPQPEIDALIAATAIVRGLTLVTRNERDFVAIPVQVTNPRANES